MLDLLRKVLAGSSGYVEIRRHKRVQTAVDARNGALFRVERKTQAGAGVRCLVDGCWGFVSTTEVTEDGLRKAISEAQEAARAGSLLRREKAVLAPAKLAKGDLEYYNSVGQPGIAEIIGVVMDTERRMRERSPLVVGSIVRYNQYEDEKYIAASDGAAVHIRDNKPSFHISATCARDGKLEMATETCGVTGSWKDLIRKASPEALADKAVELAVGKLDAGYAPGGLYTVILDPMLVGVLSHEAIGHTVEADFVLSGSAARGKIGQKVASELVTMVDDGTLAGASGMVLADDEGVAGQPTVIIDKGILREYLHDRETAASFGAEPRGNSRAFTYRDQPIIRMTNTFIQSGSGNLDQMIAEIDHGLLLKGLGQGGQADSTAEFMFGVAEAYKISHGKVGQMVKGISISGQAFEVLQSVDAVSSDFEMAMGAGHCGKWQPAKVDAGGPYLRCRVTIGGQHE
ncbi:MAG: TldD/PmbA family protein [Clostridia bacterium]|nr:TldD/PmbA family protein [Clostridia bacterium]